MSKNLIKDMFDMNRNETTTISSMIPNYDMLKAEKKYKTYTLYTPVFGGYVRLTINEDGEKNIALDYIEGGYLTGVAYGHKNDYCVNKLYKLNKKNYNGLMTLYRMLLEAEMIEVKRQLIILYGNKY